MTFRTNVNGRLDGFELISTDG